MRKGSYLTRRKVNNVENEEKKTRKDSAKKVALILKKPESLRSSEEKKLLELFSDVAKQIKKRKEIIQLHKDRIIEKEDSNEVLEKKANKLAEIISNAKHLVCYTGAGISTSAQIPDYRGSNGIWTLLQQGKEIGKYDLSLADPTFTHMALYELHRRNILRYVISQNCDGLHLRAGLPKSALSEVHGNMYVEVCKHCKPNLEYWRLFDTTESTARFNHKTNRRCYVCHKPLIDSIVHFGERGNLKWPLNWDGACKHSEKADVILCLGSSLKVLKKYSWIWQMDRPKNKRAKICIINLQWTSKDKVSTIKINGKCDNIMKKIMKYLNISTPAYSRMKDPIFSHASNLCYEELHTVTQPMLQIENSIFSPSRNSLDSADIEDDKNAVKPRSLPYVKTNINSKHIIDSELKFNNTSAFEDSDCDKIRYEPNGITNVSNNFDEKAIILNILNEKIACELDEVEKKSTLKTFVDVNGFKNIEKIQNFKNVIEPFGIYLGYLPQNSKVVQKSSVLHDVQSDLKNENTEADKKNKKNEVSKKCLMQLFDFSKFEKLPNFYEVRYAYSGLHSIIKPPPPEINLWSSNVVPVYEMNRQEAECMFCFDNYAEKLCQFYTSISADFSRSKITRKKVSACECCDYSDTKDVKNKNNETFNMLLSDKRAKLDMHFFKNPVKQIQAGWFGKGYRKTHRKKK